MSLFKTSIDEDTLPIGPIGTIISFISVVGGLKTLAGGMFSGGYDFVLSVGKGKGMIGLNPPLGRIIRSPSTSTFAVTLSLIAFVSNSGMSFDHKAILSARW